MFDVAIIGGGVVGTACLSKLTRLGKKCILLERENDVGFGSSKANSGLIHAGFDALPGTLKAKLNVRGNQLFSKLFVELGVPYNKCGHLVVGNNLEKIEMLYKRGLKNGVNDMRILKGEELWTLEPNLSKDIRYALFSSEAGTCPSYELPWAFAEDSIVNGGVVELEFDLIESKRMKDCFILQSKDGRSVKSKVVINSCGAGFNAVSKILGAEEYPTIFKRGEYIILDTAVSDFVRHTVFPLPSKGTKGVLVSTSEYGNVLIGPTSYESTSDSITTSNGLASVRDKAKIMFEKIPFGKSIRVFSGVRNIVGDDFVIEKSKLVDGIINLAGICSPGLTASPAIAEEVAKLLGLNPEIEIKNLRRRVPIRKFADFSRSQLDAEIAKDPDRGRIVCRCENVSLSEIKQALTCPLPARSVDGVKRRTRAGMGRCQGAFCLSRVMEQISLSKNQRFDDVLKESGNSKIVVSDIQGGSL